MLLSSFFSVKQLEEANRRQLSSPQQARPGKRKAAAQLQESDTEDSEDGFEKMDTDMKITTTRQDSEDEEARTPDRSDEDTTGDEDEQEEDVPIQPPSPVPRTTRSQKKEAEKEASPPPVRQLPFSKPNPPLREDDETESEADDDEL
jgi:hypothetical protein